MNWILCNQNSQVDFFCKIVDFDDYSVIDKVFFILKSSGARILLIDFLAVTMLGVANGPSKTLGLAKI